MTDRPQDWDWVSAVDTCKATVMFGELKAMAQRNVDTRNKQLGRDQFRLIEINGIEFAVNKSAGSADAVFFRVSDDLQRVLMCRGRNDAPEATYTVGLNDMGRCTFRRDPDEMSAWRVLKSALEQLFFD